LNKNFVDIKGKTLFSMFLIAFLLISTNQVNVAAASSETTYFYVDPPEVTGKSIGETFLINVSAYVTPSNASYAWEVHVGWDPNVLEVFYKAEGDFLERGGSYTTTFVSYPSFTEANVEGEITVGCSLFGNVPENEWASGDGWLCNLGFNVMAEGSSVLNLFDTSLNDHLVSGAPGPTFYPNEDGFFYSTLFHDVAVTSVTSSLNEDAKRVNVNHRLRRHRGLRNYL